RMAAAGAIRSEETDCRSARGEFIFINQWISRFLVLPTPTPPAEGPRHIRTTSPHIGACPTPAKAGLTAPGLRFGLCRMLGFGGRETSFVSLADKAFQFPLPDLAKLQDHVGRLAPHVFDERVRRGLEQEFLTLVRQMQEQAVGADHGKDPLLGAERGAAEMIDFSDAFKRQCEFADVIRARHSSSSRTNSTRSLRC